MKVEHFSTLTASEKTPVGFYMPSLWIVMFLCEVELIYKNVAKDINFITLREVGVTVYKIKYRRVHNLSGILKPIFMMHIIRRFLLKKRKKKANYVKICTARKLLHLQ